MQKKTTKYQIEYLTEKEIMKKAKEINLPKFTHILKQYFLKEDL